MPDELPIPVDVRNPGQFLACGGLLTLAAALDENATGRFDGETFHLAGADVWDVLTASEVVMTSELQDGPLLLTSGGQPWVRIDWWHEPIMQQLKFKTWSGGQHAFGFATGMLALLASSDTADPFKARAVSKPKPFYFDSRVSRLISIDLGFSTDGFTSTFSPAVELLAFVGLQRFRPRTIQQRELYGYATWAEPLPVGLAAVAATGLTTTLAAADYQFPLRSRTGGKYKAFGPAEPVSHSPT
ncbi:MAG: hypothetical protein AAF656_01680, partial [Planctomycetota bacterium]